MKFGKMLLQLATEERGKAVYSDAKNKMYSLQHQEQDFHFQVRFKDVESIGIVLDYLSVRCGAKVIDASAINERLESQAAYIQDKITFLTESFSLIELDLQNKRAQLRSYPPFCDESNKYYYEIILDEGGSAHFQRYAFSRSEKRYRKVNSQLTTEVFERLVDEFVELLV